MNRKSVKIPMLLPVVIAVLCCRLAAADTICFEAESAESIVPPMQISKIEATSEKDKVSGGSVLEIPQGSGEGKAVGGSAAFTVTIPADGRYVFWARVWWADSCGNTFSVKIGDFPPFTFGNNGTYQAWHWMKSNVRLELKKGKTSLSILNREDGIKIDQILLTSDLDFVPVGIESAAMPD
jgi:hypothetical protein